ncbi:galactokinase [Aeromicrobium sp. CF3.5]|uniref:galactokinase n=1 Tax=Aeromicrobium sp. CF3.5 TaxID=3373078 RepID=UPI003EE50203
MTDVRRWTVPGRVNLIGEHLDYNGGPVLPMAIDRHVVVRARRRDDDTIAVWSDAGKVTFSTSVELGEIDGWAALVAGVVWALGQDGPGNGHRVPGADLVIESTIPAGAGLASSAAVACGVALALDDIGDLGLDRAAVAAVARRSENEYLGAPSGVMDQLAVLHSATSLVDTRTGDVTAIDAPWGDAGLSLVVIDTGVQHAIAGGEYTSRHEECRRAAETLDLDHLADVTLDGLYRLDDEDLRSRARHVLTETARVRSAVRALADRDWPQLGTIMSAAHASLRDDFAVSCPELDTAVEAAIEAGALGARLTGFGFGGSAIALAPTAGLLPLKAAVESAFAGRGWTAPSLFTVRPSPGAHRSA